LHWAQASQSGDEEREGGDARESLEEMDFEMGSVESAEVDKSPRLGGGAAAETPNKPLRVSEAGEGDPLRGLSRREYEGAGEGGPLRGFSRENTNSKSKSKSKGKGCHTKQVVMVDAKTEVEASQKAPAQASNGVAPR